MKGTSTKTSEYGGVSWDRELQKWRSSVSENGIKYDCGYHETERDAAKSRDRKILALGLDKPLQVLKPVNKNLKTDCKECYKNNGKYSRKKTDTW